MLNIAEHSTRASCDYCGNLTPLMTHPQWAGNAETLCPACAQGRALQEASEQHLHTLLWPALVQWARYWQAAGVSRDSLQASIWTYGTYWHPDGAQGRPGAEGQALEDALRAE